VRALWVGVAPVAKRGMQDDETRFIDSGGCGFEAGCFYERAWGQGQFA
jgi:hypothetical protein